MSTARSTFLVENLVEQRTLFTKSRLARSIATLALPVLCAGAMLTHALPAHAAETGNVTGASTQATVTRDFAIPAQSLIDALDSFAGQADIDFAYRTADLQNLESRAVNGEFTVREALSILLSDTRIAASFTGGNTVSLALNESASGSGVSIQELDLTTVSGAVDGSSEAGYRTNEVTAVGPWTGRTLQDTPYSINVQSEDLLENVQATSQDQIFKMNPFTQLQAPQDALGAVQIVMRGFESTSSARNGIDRVDRNSSSGYAPLMEDVERVEILTGPSGFLYGAGDTGGIVNYVSKRPTQERLTSITVGTTAGQNAYIHGDFGGQFDDEGKLGYRINLVTQGGETNIEGHRVERDSISAIFDWQVTEDLLLDLELSSRDWLNQRGPLGWRPSGERPNADFIDPTKAWAQEWNYREEESWRTEFGLHWAINDNMTFRSRLSVAESEFISKTTDNSVQSDGTYDSRFSAWSPQTYEDEGGAAFLDIAFNTGSISHKVTVGAQFSAYSRNRYSDILVSTSSSGFNFNEPVHVPEPDWEAYGMGAFYASLKLRNRSITVGDEITLSEKWSALIGVSNAEIISSDYSPAGARTSHYADSAITPNVSLIFTPIESVTTYFSYIEALEAGGTAGDLYQDFYEVVNAGEVMEPTISEQMELGIKTTLGNTLLTASLFEIDRALEYYTIRNDMRAEFVQDGRQVHEGLEVSATGRLTDNLTLVGGLTLLNAKVEDNETNPEQEGKVPRRVAEEMYKAYLEYTLPNVPGLTLNGGVYYIGDFYGDRIEEDPIDGNTVIDVGARYETVLAGRPFTFRINISNLTDERYWTNDRFLGAARSIAVSANMDF